MNCELCGAILEQEKILGFKGFEMRHPKTKTCALSWTQMSEIRWELLNKSIVVIKKEAYTLGYEAASK